MLTLKQRFGSVDGFAPLSLGSPSVLFNVDRAAFKQTKEDKSDAVAAKWRHKKFMERHGIDGKKFLNVPSNRLEKTIITT